MHRREALLFRRSIPALDRRSTVARAFAAASNEGVVMGHSPVVFVSYSREDAGWRDRFTVMLKPRCAAGGSTCGAMSATW
jgi:hypothetical protein